MVTTQQDTFKAFVPIDIIEKGEKDKDGLPEELLIAGVASNANTGRDKDGQWLDVNGFNYKPFLKSGFFNLEHGYMRSKDPSLIVGEPTDAYVEDNQFHVKGRLYKSNPKAVALYQLANVLKKSGSTRRIGYSIEGDATEYYDPDFKSKVKKADIYHCALTISPKNDGTEMNIVKGENFNYETQLNSDYLIDVIDNDVRYTVDKDLNIEADGKDLSELIKAMVAGDMTGRDTKNKLSTGDALKQESIDKKKKNSKDKKVLSKGEIISKIFSMFNFNDAQTANNFYSLVEQVQNKLTPNMSTTITPEAIEKAKEILGLVKAEEKTETTPDVEGNDLANKKNQEKLKEISALLAKAEELKNSLGEEPKKEEPKVEVKKEEDSPLIKGLEERIKALTTMNASHDEAVSKIDKLEKAFESITNFQKQLGEKLGMIEKQPLDRKSISSESYVDRFAKGGEGDDSKVQTKVMNLKDKEQQGEIADILYKAATKDPNKIDDRLAKAVTCVELGSLGATEKEASELFNMLKKEHGITVINK